MSDTSYADAYRDIDFRKHPERYKVGRGEQGVLLCDKGVGGSIAQLDCRAVPERDAQ